MTPKTDKAGNIVTVNPYAEGFLPKKAVEPTADMNLEALNAFISGDVTKFDMVDSRAAEIIGSRGQSPKEAPKTSFADLARAGVDFGGSRKNVQTVSYSPTRIVEALDRHLEAHQHVGSELPKLAHSDSVKKGFRKPVKSKAPTTTTFDRLNSGGRELLFSGHGEAKTRQPLFFSLHTFVVKGHKG